MIRTQIHLTERQAKALRKLAAARGISMAAAIREAVDRLVREPDRRELWKRAMSVVGKYSSGLRDVTERHDDYFADAVFQDLQKSRRTVRSARPR